MDTTSLMRLALDQARLAAEHGDVPIGAVVADRNGEVVASAPNRRVERNDPTAHAEIIALADAAGVVGDWRLHGHTLVVTLEPCAMCAGAAVNARLERIVYGPPDPKAGACWSLYNIPQDRRLNHYVELEEGVLADESGELLRSFFATRRG